MASDDKRKNRGETEMVEARTYTNADAERIAKTAPLSVYDGSAARERANKAKGLRRRNDSTDVREVAPARDPGGGAGRIRPSRPTLSRRELGEQERRARHDASSERMRLRRAAGPISSRGPTSSQGRVMSSAPTAADFLNARVGAITAASQPNAAESEAKKFGLRRLESDRQFATDTRDQNTLLRGQDMTDRISLRETDADRDIARADRESSERISRMERADERGTFGERNAGGVIASAARGGTLDALKERFGAETNEDLERLIGSDMDTFAQRSRERLPFDADNQDIADLYSLNIALAQSENRGFLPSLFGAEEAGEELNAADLVSKIITMAAEGGEPQLRGGTQFSFGGRKFDYADMKGDQRRLFDEMMNFAERAIVDENSNIDDETRLNFAQSRIEQEKAQLEEVIQAGEDTRGGLQAAGALYDAFRPGEREERREAAREARERMQELEELTPAQYIGRLRDEAERERTQGQFDAAIRPR